MRIEAAGAGERFPAGAVNGITGLRFLPDETRASLVNLSSTGLLAESRARLRVGAPVCVQFEGGFKPERVNGRVARCEVAQMTRDGVLHYRIGVEFDAALVLEGDTMTAPTAGTDGDVRNHW